MGLRRRGDVEVARGSRVWREAIEDAVAVDVFIVVVVVAEGVDLYIRRPARHDLELPLAARLLRHLRGDTLIEAPLVERTTGEQLRDAAGRVVAMVRVNDHGRRLCKVTPV